jgi:hypothetical protein
VRRFLPWALLVLLLVAMVAAAALGFSQSPNAVVTPATAGPQEPLFVGMTVGQAVGEARSRGVSVRVWPVPASDPAGTVMQQVSEQPVFLVVSTGPLRQRDAVLPGAVGRPVQPECAPGFALDADGNAGPVTCHGDEVDVATWDYFAASHPPLLTLGRAATKCAVAGAYDDAQLTAAMNSTVFRLADAYYGWSFGPAFTDQLVSSGASAGGCGGGG